MVHVLSLCTILFCLVSGLTNTVKVLWGQLSFMERERPQVTLHALFQALTGLLGTRYNHYYSVNSPRQDLNPQETIDT